MDTTKYLNYADAANRINMTTKWLYRAKAERRIPFHKFGRLVHFHVDDLDDYARRQRVTSTPGAALASCSSTCTSATGNFSITGLDISGTTLPGGGKPTGKGVKFRLTGSITNEGTGVMSSPQISIYFGASSPVPATDQYRMLQCNLAAQVGEQLQPGQTLEITEAWCPDFNRSVADKHLWVRVRALGASGPSTPRSNLKLEYAAA